jgi:hypothetical protein
LSKHRYKKRRAQVACTRVDALAPCCRSRGIV